MAAQRATEVAATASLNVPRLADVAAQHARNAGREAEVGADEPEAAPGAAALAHLLGDLAHGDTRAAPGTHARLRVITTAAQRMLPQPVTATRLGNDDGVLLVDNGVLLLMRVRHLLL